MRLSFLPSHQKKTITIKGSKSETNRLLILQALGHPISLSNLSSSQDTYLLKKALTHTQGTIDIGMAGTAMRFLTAYYAVSPQANIMLTGSQRMKQRPIAPLVSALQKLGAEIKYLEKDGFPPLSIKGKRLKGGSVSISSSVSSQYISALLMIGGSMDIGLQLTLEGEVVSAPYIDMTLSLLQRLGVVTEKKKAMIKIASRVHTEYKTTNCFVESDWSSASYYYSIMALMPGDMEIYLSSYLEDSLQGDQKITEIYRTFFGVDTKYIAPNMIKLTKRKNFSLPKSVTYDFSETPDLAQGVAVTCLGLKIPLTQKGLQTLRIKETDRIQALYKMLYRCGAEVSCGEDWLQIDRFSSGKQNLPEIETYDDHRMAMAFAPLAIKFSICIKNPNVVQKSYPEFWDDLKKVGFIMQN